MTRLIDITMTIHIRTDMAIKATDGRRVVWLPPSQIEIEEQPDGTIEVTMPEWLAIEKGLV